MSSHDSSGQGRRDRCPESNVVPFGRGSLGDRVAARRGRRTREQAAVCDRGLTVRGRSRQSAPRTAADGLRGTSILREQLSQTLLRSDSCAQPKRLSVPLYPNLTPGPARPRITTEAERGRHIGAPRSAVASGLEAEDREARPAARVHVRTAGAGVKSDTPRVRHPYVCEASRRCARKRPAAREARAGRESRALPPAPGLGWRQCRVRYRTGMDSTECSRNRYHRSG